MSVHSISSLPLELLTTICSHLSRQDQRATRLVSRLFNTAAQTPLFQVIFLKLNLRSFQRLQEIAKHEVLSKQVRTLCFDPRQLREPAWSVGFDYWCDHIVGTGMSIYSNHAAAEDPIKSYGPEALKRYFSGYRNFMEGFKSLVSRGKWAGMLYSSIQGLPGLSEIYYTEGTYHNPQWLVTDLHDGLDRIEPDPRLAKEMFAVPSLPSSYDTGFWRLLKLISSSTASACNITKISGLDLESQAWAMSNSTELTGIFRKFPNLRDLALTFENTDGTYPEDYIHVPGILATAGPNLRSLSLRIRYGHDPDNKLFHRRSLGLRDLIGHSSSSSPPPQQQEQQQQQQQQYCYWPRLQHLDLYGLIIKEKDLHDLLRHHAPTLRYLHLSHVELQPTSFPRRYKRRTWVRVVSSLVQSSTSSTTSITTTTTTTGTGMSTSTRGLECVVFDSVSTAVVENEDVVGCWFASGVRARGKAELKKRYPCREFFGRVFRDGEFRDVFEGGGCGEEEGVSREEEDKGVVLGIDRLGIGEVHHGGGGGDGGDVVGDWIFGDRDGHFDSALQQVTCCHVGQRRPLIVV